MVGYQLEDVSVSNFSTQVPAFFRANSSGLTSAASLQLSYDRRDNRVSTKKGVYFLLSTEYSDDLLGATNRYFRLVSDNRVYFKLPKNMWR